MIGVYIAGASAEHERVKRWANELQAVRDWSESKRAWSGQLVHITFRWFDNAAEWTGKDHALPLEQQRMHARDDQRAIRAARIFWWLAPKTFSRGADTELGLALAHRWHFGDNYMQIIATGPEVNNNIFAADADFQCVRDKAGFLAASTRVRELHRDGERVPYFPLQLVSK